MLIFTVGFLAVIAAATLQMIIGFLWYGPLLFGRIWMRAAGFTKESLDEAKRHGMGATYGAAYLAAVVNYFILGVFIRSVGAFTPLSGAWVGFLAALGFVVTVQFTGMLFETKSKPLFFIAASYQLISFTAGGALLAMWG